MDFEKSDVDLLGGQREGEPYPQGGRRSPEKINNEDSLLTRYPVRVIIIKQTLDFIVGVQ